MRSNKRKVSRLQIQIAAIAAATVLATIESVLADTLPFKCERWHIRKLDSAPDWYGLGLAAVEGHTKRENNDSLVSSKYALTDSSSLVYYERLQGVLCEEEGNWCRYGRLYFCGQDTVLLDSTDHSFSNLSFSSDRRRCVAAERIHVSEDGSDDVVVMFDLVDRQKVVLSTLVRSDIPKISPDGEWVVFSDIGDLYVCNLATRATELLFKRGGSYTIGGPCMYQWLSDIQWSQDSHRFLFRYKASVFKDAFEIWEACLLEPQEAGDMTQ